MGNLADIRLARPSSPLATRGGARHRAVPEASDRAGIATRVVQLHGPYRKSHRDLSCIRVVAASAIVAGLLLGTAPVALAQVGLLIASVPAAFAQEVPAADVSSAGAGEEKVDNAPGATVQHRLAGHSATSLISWTGTSEALRCSYGLLFEGTTRSCQAA